MWHFLLRIKVKRQPKNIQCGGTNIQLSVTEEDRSCMGGYVKKISKEIEILRY